MIFNASNSCLGKFPSRILPGSLYDEKADSLSLPLINSSSKLETSDSLLRLKMIALYCFLKLK